MGVGSPLSPCTGLGLARCLGAYLHPSLGGFDPVTLGFPQNPGGSNSACSRVKCLVLSGERCQSSVKRVIATGQRRGKSQPEVGLGGSHLSARRTDGYGRGVSPQADTPRQLQGRRRDGCTHRQCPSGSPTPTPRSSFSSRASASRPTGPAYARGLLAGPGTRVPEQPSHSEKPPHRPSGRTARFSNRRAAGDRASQQPHPPKAQTAE